jgi:hypothetical protein
MCNDISAPLIGLLQDALNHPIERSRLLQQPERLQEIMNNIPTRRWLFEQACQPDVLNRDYQARDLIITMMQSSRLLWHGGIISPEVYHEALSRTWEWFARHFQTYNPERASFITWFNRKLGWMIQDVIQEIAIEEGRRLRPSTNVDDSEWIYPPAPDADRWNETIHEWLALVQNHPHLFRACQLQNSPHVNCQVLLIQILTVLLDSGEFSWKSIAQDYAVEALVLRNFCKRRCLPRFKQLLSE